MDATLLSIGIDIGTATTQVLFSKLTFKNMADSFSAPQVSLVEKQIIYRGEVYETPLQDQYNINIDVVQQIIENEYLKAQISPEEVDTGAVIITGESATKQNAAQVLELMTTFAGEFVVAAA